MRRRLLLISSLGAALIASVAVAKGKGILFPDWSQPTKGSYEAPSGKVGEAVSKENPWSVTTITSSIQGQPIKGKPFKAVGEIIDLSCYNQVGKHGDKHRDCGQKCARSGQPIGLLTKDGTTYMLIAEEHDPRRDGQTSLRDWAIEHMAHVVEASGTLTEVEGQRTVFVQGFVRR